MVRKLRKQRSPSFTKANRKVRLCNLLREKQQYENSRDMLISLAIFIILLIGFIYSVVFS